MDKKTLPPKDYRDPYWVGLAQKAEKAQGLPSGLLVNILTKGERTPNGTVSSAGARTPFQIIPQTRDMLLKQHGIDPYLNDENAAMGAAMLLKGSLDRNSGNVAAAAAEYHAGPNRKLWGPKTIAYAQRVTGQDVSGDSQNSAVSAKPSGFDAMLAEVQGKLSGQEAKPSGVAQKLADFKAGKMSPEEAADFRDQVESGELMLPRGATLGPEKKTPQVQAVVLPDEVAARYIDGKLSQAQTKDLEDDMRAGLVEVRMPKLNSDGVEYAKAGIPELHQKALQGKKSVPVLYGISEVEYKPEEPSFGQKLVGSAETGLGLASGATTGYLSGVMGALQHAADYITPGVTPKGTAEEAFIRGMQSGTYEPRTEQGRQQFGAAGNFLAETLPIMPSVTGIAGAVESAMPTVRATAGAARQAIAESPEAFAAQRALAVARPAVTQAVEQVRNLPSAAVERAQAAGQGVVNRVGDLFGRTPEEATAPAAGGSVGAAGMPMESLRRQKAQELDIPIDLTTGQATREPTQVRFEQEVAKQEIGAPIRQRLSEQRQKVEQNFDAWIEGTGAEKAELRDVGIVVGDALEKSLAREKTKVQNAYALAERAGELEQPVTLNKVVDYLNDVPVYGLGESTRTVDAARAAAIKLGIVSERADGTLEALPVSLKMGERFRKEVGNRMGTEPTNIREGTILKGLYDEETATAGGKIFKQARRLHARMAERFKNHSVISDLMQTKRGSADRKVALEDTLDRVMVRSSLDDVKHARKVLQTSGEEGQQAWRELQGGLLRKIQEEATKSAVRDENGRPIISAPALDKAIRRLDEDGKLDFVFGKKGAEKLRVINDVSKDLFTVPPGSVNTSNTASVLLAAIDGAMSGTTGLPLPIMTSIRYMTKNIKDRKIKARIAAALKRVNP